MKTHRPSLDHFRSPATASSGAHCRATVHLILGIALLALASFAETWVHQTSNHVVLSSLTAVTLLLLVIAARTFVPARATVHSVHRSSLADDQAQRRESDLVLLREETAFRQPPLH